MTDTVAAPDGPPTLETLAPDVRDALSSAVLADSLDAVGERHQVMSVGVTPVQTGLRALGRAATVAFAPHDVDSDDPYAAAIGAIDGLESGSVVVIGTGADNRTAYWGELFSAAAIGRGARGTVTDGPTRDTAGVRALGYPLFGQGTRPIDYRARMAITTVNESITCGGVVVAPGDIVLADDDGVVVVPQRVESEVLARAHARVTAESSVLAELLSGARLEDVWNRWGVL